MNESIESSDTVLRVGEAILQEDGEEILIGRHGRVTIDD
jgi:hypothetical protein